MDQHANSWSRCLNSCLLTLATATLAIQKIAEQSVKEEVLESKEGATYFSGMSWAKNSMFPLLFFTITGDNKLHKNDTMSSDVLVMRVRLTT